MEDLFKAAVTSLKHYISIPNKDLNWWIRFRAPQDILKNHATFLYCEVVFYCLGFLTLLHALRNGGRYPWLWLATVLHGLTVECVSYALLDIDNFWHAQSMIMLLGQRLPLHIMFVYPAFIYTASVAVSHMNLRWWAEPFAVGLGAVLLDIPFDIMGVKLLWWTWHDDDPNIFDRHYWVPWTSYYFHAAFSSSLVLVFHGVRAICCRRELKFQSSGFICELLCALVTGLFSMPLGILQFAPVYHPLHDLFRIHSEVCVLMLICLYILIVWSADRYPFETARITYSSSTKKWEYHFNWLDGTALSLCLVCGFTLICGVSYQSALFDANPYHEDTTTVHVAQHSPTGLQMDIKRIDLDNLQHHELSYVQKNWKSKEIFLAMLLHYSFYIYLVLFSKPETSVSIGYHQRTGPCGETVPVHTPFGMVLNKTRFLCVDAYYEDYFDFHCVKVMPGHEKEWYTVCGTPFPNHLEYIVVIFSFCFVGLYWYWQLLLLSGPLPKTSNRVHRVKKD